MSKSVTFKGLDAGNYSVNVTYAETTNYNGVFCESYVCVFKQGSSVVIGEIANVTYPDKVVISFNIENETRRIINISDGESDLLDYLINGDGNIIFDWSSGNFTITITNEGTDNVEESSDSAVFAINSGNRSLDVTVIAHNGTVSENPTFTIMTPDDYKGKVNITVNGKTVTRDVDDEVVFDKLPVGKYNATMTFYDSDEYENAIVNVPFDVYVVSTIISGNLVRSYNSDYDFRATFTDEFGNVLPNTNVTFIIDGVEHGATTNSKGVASITLKLGVDMYNVVSVSPDGSEVDNTLTIVPRITENKALDMYYDDGSAYKVKIIGDDGKVVGAGQSVKFTVNGKTHTVKTDSKGYAALKVTLPPKTYSVSAEYKGYKVSNKVVVKSHFIGKSKVTVKRKLVNKRGYLSIKHNMGKYFAGKSVTLKFLGKKYVVKVDKKGKLTFKIKKNVVSKLKVGKKYSYTLIYKLDKKSRHIKVYKDRFVFTS